MVSSTNFSLYVLTASAITTIVEGFGTIDPVLSICGRRRLHKTVLWLEKGEDLMEQRGDQSSTSFCDDMALIDADYDQNKEASPVVADVPPHSAANERRSTATKEDIENDVDDRAGALRKVLELFGDVGNADDRMPVGSTVVVSGLSLPDLGIEDWQSYELVSVYDQGVDDNGLPVKIPRKDLQEAKPIPYGYKRYCTLYSDRYHKESGPVIVSPDEIQLVSVRDEVFDSLLMASPVFGFWTALAVSFANSYNERYGGNFLDAIFRT